MPSRIGPVNGKTIRKWKNQRKSQSRVPGQLDPPDGVDGAIGISDGYGEPSDLAESGKRRRIQACERQDFPALCAWGIS